MLFFGHIGLTTGIVKVCQDLITSTRSGHDKTYLDSESGTIHSGEHSLLNTVQKKMRLIDYRFILLGALLPDIIDKPLWFFTDSTFQWDGRGYSHTFLFSFSLLVIGLVLAIWQKKAQLLTVSVGSFFHLIFDQMWLNPITLWWPLLGPIQRDQTSGWLYSLWHGLLSNPYDYVSESLGFIIILYIVLRLIMNKQVKYFLKTGNIDWRQEGSSKVKGQNSKIQFKS